MIRALAIVACLALAAPAIAAPKLQLPKPRQAEIFVRALGAKQPNVRRVALDHLAELADQSATRAAAKTIASIALDDKQSLDVRQSALIALIAMPGVDAVESLWPLMKALQPDHLTGFAAIALAKHVDAAGTANHVSATKLAAYLLVWIKVPDGFTSRAAAEALGALGPRVLADLRVLVPKASHAQLRGIAEALAFMGPAAAPALPELYTALDAATSSLDREQLVDTIERIEGKPSLKLKLAALGKPGDKLAIFGVSRAVEKLGPAAHEALDPLLAQLSPDTAGTTFGALEHIIAPADHARVAKVAASYVESKDGYTQRGAISLLVKCGAPGRAVLEGVLDHGSTHARSTVLSNVDKLGDQLARVTAFARGQDPELRRAGLRSLGAFGARAEQVLVAALADRDRNIRDAAIDGLGKVRTQGAVTALIAAAGDADKDLRSAAVDSLGELGPIAVGAVDAIITADAKWPVGRATEAIVKLGPGAIPALRKIVGGNAPGETRKRSKAAEALGAFKAAADPAVPELVAMLGGEGRSHDERFSAALALSMIGAKRTLADFESALLDSEPIVREIAARTIGELGGPSDAGRRLLVDLVAHGDSASEYAIGTLTAHGVPADLLPHFRAVAGNANTTSMARSAAVRALTAANDRSAQTLATLRTAMQKDESVYVREPAAEALLALGTEADFFAAIVVIDGAPDQRDAENAAAMRQLGEMLKEP